MERWSGKLPTGLPEVPTDPKERDAFMKTIPVDAGTYSSMLALKKDPSKLMNVHQDEFKGALSSLAQEKEEVKTKATVEEKHEATVEIIKAAPKAFKKALKALEKIVPEATHLLLDAPSDETD